MKLEPEAAQGDGVAYPEEVLQCQQCDPGSDIPDGDSRCVSCRMKAMDPFNEVVEQGGVLVCRRLGGGCMDFTLDLPELRQWRRDNLNVEVRMVRPGKSRDLHVWPRRLDLHANGRLAFGIAPPEAGHKRRDVPEDISVSLRPGENHVSVQAEDDRAEDYVLAVLLTAPRADADLTGRVVEVPLETARRRAVALLHGGTPGEAAAESQAGSQEVECMTSATLKLTCPITMERVVGPVRGKECQHVQCFGLDAYLAINRQMRAFNSRWCCPVCARVVRPADLCDDPYVARVAGDAKRGVADVEVARDGGWRPIPMTRPSLPVAAPTRGPGRGLDAAAAPTPKKRGGLELARRVAGATPRRIDVLELDDGPLDGDAPHAEVVRVGSLAPRSAGGPRAVARCPSEGREESSQELLVPAASAPALPGKACSDPPAARGEESSQEMLTAAAAAAESESSQEMLTAAA